LKRSKKEKESKLPSGTLLHTQKIRRTVNQQPMGLSDELDQSEIRM
jgi:hypothetical protein